MKDVFKECIVGMLIAFALLLFILPIIAFHVSGHFYLDSTQGLLKLMTIVLSSPVYFIAALSICLKHSIWSVLIAMMLSVIFVVFILQIIKTARAIKLRYQIATYLTVIGAVGAYSIQLVAN